MRETATLTVNDAPFVDEEQFGPALPTISDCDVNAAIAAANNSPTALGELLGVRMWRRLVVWPNRWSAVQSELRSMAPFSLMLLSVGISSLA